MGQTSIWGKPFSSLGACWEWRSPFRWSTGASATPFSCDVEASPLLWQTGAAVSVSPSSFGSTTSIGGVYPGIESSFSNWSVSSSGEFFHFTLLSDWKNWKSPLSLFFFAIKHTFCIFLSLTGFPNRTWNIFLKISVSFSVNRYRMRNDWWY